MSSHRHSRSLYIPCSSNSIGSDGLLTMATDLHMQVTNANQKDIFLAALHAFGLSTKFKPFGIADTGDDRRVRLHLTFSSVCLK